MQTDVSLFSKVAGLALLGCLLGANPAGAQTGSGSPPPTYDYDPEIAGTQPPKSPLLADYEYRSVRTYQVSIPVLVPLSQLQAILPAGYQAIASPAESQTASLSLGFFMDQRFERPGVAQTYGPVSALLVSTTVLNTNVNPARQELVFPSFSAGGEVDALNASFGPGSARLADVKVKVEEKNGKLYFTFDVNDASLGFKIHAEAQSSAALNTRSVSDPVGLAFRTFNGTAPNNAFRAASQSDTLSVPVKDAKVKLQTRGHKLRFPAGTLSIVGLGATVGVSRNVEFILKFEQP
ncbi:MAG: hypothetical protein ACO1SX_15375 [Actinomycetota bacterium]